MSEASLRIFYALWPDAMTRRMMLRSFQAVDELADIGRPVNVQNLHLTLHFIGNIKEHDLECYLRAGDAVAVSPFTLKLTSAGGFSRAQVAWLGCHVYPLQLSQLHEQLGEQLRECGYVNEDRPFRPHVTMARKVRAEIATRPIDAIRWRVNRFVLLESVQVKSGVQYRVRQSWPLLV
jgi:2'-5' RNA ligase